MHAFCLRLQDKDPTYIRRFIQRHLNFRPAFKKPYLLQDLTPSLTPQTCYERVSLSLHLPHLFLLQGETGSANVDEHDREFLGHFGPRYRHRDGIEGLLYKACTSVLLTLTVPLPHKTQNEATHLLSNPEALWTVLVINAPLRIVEGYREESSQHLTLLAQFVRGVHCAAFCQRTHLVRILVELKQQLSDSVS